MNLVCVYKSTWYSQCVVDPNFTTTTTTTTTTALQTTEAPTTTVPVVTTTTVDTTISIAPSPKTSVVIPPPGKLPYTGVNLAGAEFGSGNIPGTLNKDYTWPDQSTINFFTNAGMNVFRLPILWERLQPILNGAFDSTYQSGLDATIKMMNAAGATVIVEPHNFARYRNKIIGTTDVPNSAFVDFWVRMSNLYSSNSQVWFNLMNEPHDQDSVAWAVSAQAAISAIRDAGFTGVIQVPGVRWTGAHSWLAIGGNDGTVSNGDALKNITDPLNNFFIEVHQYLDVDHSGTHTECVSATAGADRLASFTAWARENGMKAWLGEMGASDNPTCVSAFTSALEHLEANRDVYQGFTYWAAGAWWPLSDVNEIQPRSACGKLPCKINIWNAYAAHFAKPPLTTTTIAPTASPSPKPSKGITVYTDDNLEDTIFKNGGWSNQINFANSTLYLGKSAISVYLPPANYGAFSLSIAQGFSPVAYQYWKFSVASGDANAVNVNVGVKDSSDFIDTYPLSFWLSKNGVSLSATGFVDVWVDLSVYSNNGNVTQVWLQDANGKGTSYVLDNISFEPVKTTTTTVSSTPAITSPPAVSSVVVYTDDKLENTLFQNWGWGNSLNFANTSLFLGKSAISVEITPSSYGAFSLALPTGFSPNTYKYWRFFVASNDVNAPVINVGVKDSADTVDSYPLSFWLNQNGKTLSATALTEVWVDLSVYTNNGNIVQVWLQDSTGQGTTFVLDNISFEPTKTSTITTTTVAVSPTASPASGVVVYKDGNLEDTVFQNWGWGNQINFANTSLFLGTSSMSVIITPSTYGAFSLALPTGFSPSTYKFWRFFIASDNTNAVNANVGVKDSAGTVDSYPLSYWLKQNGVSLSATQFAEVWVDLSVYSNNGNITQLWLQDSNGQGTTFVLDDVSFEVVRVGGSVATTTTVGPSPTALPGKRLPYTGVNLAGAEFGSGSVPGTPGKDYTWPEQSTVTFFTKAGMNIFRLPILWERLQPKLYGEFNATYQAGLDATIKMMNDAGATVIIDPHNFGRYPYVNGNLIGSAAVPNAAFDDFWTRLSNLYKGNPKIWFDIMNEPFNQDSVTWAASAQSALNAIRAAGFTNVVQVPGVRWTGAHSWFNTGGSDGSVSNADALKSIKDPLNNFQIEIHQYLDSDSSGTHNECTSPTIGVERIAIFTLWARQNGFKAWLGEIGASDTPTCVSAFSGVLEFMEANSDVYQGVSYWAAGAWWPLSDVNEIQPRSACGKLPCKIGIWNAFSAHFANAPSTPTTTTTVTNASPKPIAGITIYTDDKLENTPFQNWSWGNDINFANKSLFLGTSAMSVILSPSNYGAFSLALPSGFSPKAYQYWKFSIASDNANALNVNVGVKDSSDTIDTYPLSYWLKQNGGALSATAFTEVWVDLSVYSNNGNITQVWLQDANGQGTTYVLDNVSFEPIKGASTSPSPSPSPKPTAGIKVYSDDQLEPTIFQNWGWGNEVNFANKSLYFGTSSVSVVITPNTYGAFSLGIPTGFSPNAYQFWRFFVASDNANALNANVGVKDSEGTVDTYPLSFWLKQSGGTLSATSLTEVWVDLSIYINNGNVTQVWIQDSNAQGTTFVLDEISFEPIKKSIPVPTIVPTTSAAAPTTTSSAETISTETSSIASTTEASSSTTLAETTSQASEVTTTAVPTTIDSTSTSAISTQSTAASTTSDSTSEAATTVITPSTQSSVVSTTTSEKTSTVSTPSTMITLAPSTTTTSSKSTTTTIASCSTPVVIESFSNGSEFNNFGGYSGTDGTGSYAFHLGNATWSPIASADGAYWFTQTFNEGAPQQCHDFSAFGNSAAISMSLGKTSTPATTVTIGVDVGCDSSHSFYKIGTINLAAGTGAQNVEFKLFPTLTDVANLQSIKAILIVADPNIPSGTSFVIGPVKMFEQQQSPFPHQLNPPLDQAQLKQRREPQQPLPLRQRNKPPPLLLPTSIIGNSNWKISSSNGVASIDTTNPKHGRKALRLQVSGNGYSFLSPNTFNPPGNSFFGRINLYVKQFPRKPDYAHFINVEVKGTGNPTLLRPIGGQYIPGETTCRWGVGADLGATGDWTDHQKTVPTVDAKYQCMEWQMNSTDNSIQVWIDGVLKPEMSVSTQKHGGNQVDLVFPLMNSIRIGWQLFQSTTDSFDVFIDDIALGTSKIGC
ncbi:hypothetical protein HK098_003089 [Nowakowskiella sp. JEL0407]|nr:hypothetical protein HK098_003089 [Nowakowskiella sp. JEL0407]